MEFINYTPFAANAWDTVNSHNQWHCTNLARVRFALVPSKGYCFEQPEWTLKLHPEQGELFDEDIFYTDNADKIYRQTGDASLASVRFESDYVNFKPSTDIVFNAHTHAPNGQALSDWQCGVNIYPSQNDFINKRACNGLRLEAQGPNDVIGRKRVSSVPIRYEYCAGGITKLKRKGKDDQSVTLHPYNPIGVGKDGFADATDQNASQDKPKVQIAYAPSDPMRGADAPAGLGFIHRGWRSRLMHAGTYDEQWLAEQHPLPPHDFDYVHHQGAHPALVTPSYLRAGAYIEWHNLMPNAPRGYCKVPELKLLSRVHTALGTRLGVMHLDTLIIDIDDPNPDNYSVYASWRSFEPLITEATRSEVMLVPLAPNAKARNKQANMDEERV